MAQKKRTVGTPKGRKPKASRGGARRAGAKGGRGSDIVSRVVASLEYVAQANRPVTAAEMSVVARRDSGSVTPSR